MICTRMVGFLGRKKNDRCYLPRFSIPAGPQRLYPPMELALHQRRLQYSLLHWPMEWNQLINSDSSYECRCQLCDTKDYYIRMLLSNFSQFTPSTNPGATNFLLKWQVRLVVHWRQCLVLILDYKCYYSMHELSLNLLILLKQIPPPPDWHVHNFLEQSSAWFMQSLHAKHLTWSSSIEDSRSLRDETDCYSPKDNSASSL